jgi:hypothetical protein
MRRLRKGFGDAFLHEHTRTRTIDLSLVEPYGVNDALDGFIEIGIIEHACCNVTLDCLPMSASLHLVKSGNCRSAQRRRLVRARRPALMRSRMWVRSPIPQALAPTRLTPAAVFLLTQWFT